MMQFIHTDLYFQKCGPWLGKDSHNSAWLRWPTATNA